MDENVRAVLAGQLPLGKIPDIPSKVVRVFLSCTPTDMIEERLALMKNVYPQLREYCREKHGLELQMVDLRWGISENQQCDPDHSNSLIKELERCQAVSAGPNFVALIGQRYGYRPLPAAIPEIEYDLIRTALRKNRSRETRDAGMLDHWYFRDTNAVPPVYVLQQISDIIPNFANTSDRAKFLEAEEQWHQTYVAVRKFLQKGADLCFLEGTFDKHTKHKYYMSEFENEIRHGMENSSNPKSSAFAFIREIADLKNYICDQRTRKFMEIQYNWKEEKLEIDLESQELLQELRDKQVPVLVGSGNTQRFSILWREDKVVDPELHKDYLDEFCSQFHDILVRMVDQAAYAQEVITAPPIYKTVIEHWSITKRKSDGFYGRELLMDSIYGYITGNSKQPLVIYGDSGSGKTCLIAKAQEEVVQWVPNCITVVRFLGINADASDIQQVVYGICVQLALVLKRDTTNIPNDYKALLKYFFDQLNNIPEHQHLVLFLDSLDQLNPEHNAHYMVWLPEQLNPNVKIILTTLPEKHSILNRLRREVIKNDNYFLEVPPLSLQGCIELMDFFLQRQGRRISDAQLHVIRRAFECCSLPLFVRMLVEELVTWRSYSKPNLKLIVNTIQQAANLMFDQLEKKHGRILVSSALSYMTASHTGLSEMEMEDLLSLDDTVLDEVFQERHPPIRRLPTSYWVRLRSDLDAFLYQKEVDGVCTNFWNHREFEEAAKKRYLADDNTTKRIYAEMADYFAGEWNQKPKPFRYTLKVAKEMKLAKPDSVADRFVPSQPLTFCGSDGKTRYNKRKYDQVPRTLYLSGRLIELNRMAFFNYLWLYNKAKALSIQHIIATFALNPGVETDLVKDCIQSCQPIITRNMNNFAAEITGRLLTYYPTHPNIRSFIQQCDTVGLKHSALVPNFPYHQVPGGPLQHTMESSCKLEFFQLVGDEESRFLLAKDRSSPVVKTFDLATGEWKFDVFASSGDLYLTPDGDNLVLLDHITEKSIKVHKADTGEFRGQLIPITHIEVENKQRYKMGCICVSNHFLCIIVTIDTSFLCIASVNECKFIEIVGLDGKATVCKITPDSRYVFVNSNTTLLTYDMYTLEHVCSVPLEHRPNILIFSKNSTRAYVTNIFDNKITVLHMKDGYIDLAYKIVLEEVLRLDRIAGITLSNSEKFLLARGQNNIIIYNLKTDRVVHQLTRPTDIPKEFRLPRSSLTDLVFTQAAFSQDDRFIVATIFRNVYLWSTSTGKLVTTLQAPMGIITSLFLPPNRKQIVTHLSGSDVIHVWSLDDAIKHVETLDRLTGCVQEILVTADNSVAFVRCQNSDEIGVIDMCTGQLLDLLTHESPLTDLAITPDGRYTFVSVIPRKPCVTNKIWHMEDRKLIHEFGVVGGFCVAMSGSNSIIHICQKDLHFKAPYYVRQFNFEDDRVDELECDFTLNFVLCKPFVTKDDKYLIVLTASEYDESNAHYVKPTICAFSIENDFSVASYGPDDLRSCANLRRVLDVRAHNSNPYAVIVLFSNGPEEVEGCTNGYSTDFDIGFMVLDVCSGAVVHVCDNFFAPKTRLDRILINKDVTMCMDEESNIFDITTGYFIKQLPISHRPQRLALNGKAVVYFEAKEVFVVRIADGKEIARCDVHSDIACVEMCHDQRTIIVGCTDGAIVSYVLIDEKYDTASEVLKQIPSRQVIDADMDGRLSRSWDKVEFNSCPPYSRPTSALSLSISEKHNLKMIKPVKRVRPKSDTLIYLSPKSKACSIM